MCQLLIKFISTDLCLTLTIYLLILMISWVSGTISLIKGSRRKATTTRNSAPSSASSLRDSKLQPLSVPKTLLILFLAYPA